MMLESRLGVVVCCLGYQLIKVSAETNNPVEWTVEDNYKFRLSNMEEKLLHWASQPDGEYDHDGMGTL